MRSLFAPPPPTEAPSAKRYMESPDYLELRGVGAAAVATKAAFLKDRRKRDLLFFLQAMSLRPRGLDGLTEQLVNEFPERIAEVEPEAWERANATFNEWVYERRHRTPVKKSTPADRIAEGRAETYRHLPEFLLALCVNPKLFIAAPGEARPETKYCNEVQRHYPTVHDHEIKPASVAYFKDIVPTLYEFMQRHAERIRREFVMTEVGERVFAALDVALGNPERIAMIEGREGVGKSKCAEAWCEQHLGSARYIKLSGIMNRTTFMGTLARALGIPTRSYAAAQLQGRIEDVLHQTKLMLVIDEAHYLFGASDRFRTQPELLNWVYTACANFGVPVALLTTAMFGAKMRQAEKQVVWNAGQFERRVRPYVKLPDVPRAEDLQAIARKLLPQAGKITIDLAVGYAGASKHPFTDLVDAIKDARGIGELAGRAEPSLADMKAAVLDCRQPSDKAAAEAFSAPPTRQRRSSRRVDAEPLQDRVNDVSDPILEGHKRDTFEGVMPTENHRLHTPISGRAGGDLVTG
jgi:hypothetical protein